MHYVMYSEKEWTETECSEMQLCNALQCNAALQSVYVWMYACAKDS